MALTHIPPVLDARVRQQVIEIPQTSVANGGTGVIASIAVPIGCMVVVRARFFAGALTAAAFYDITTVAKNVAGTTALISTEAKTAKKDTSAWDVVSSANDTADTIDYTATADATTATLFHGVLEVITTKIPK